MKINPALEISDSPSWNSNIQESMASLRTQEEPARLVREKKILGPGDPENFNTIKCCHS